MKWKKIDGACMSILNSLIEFKSKMKVTKFYVHTAILGVNGSYPEPPEAKHTPVLSSWGCKYGSKYAGTSSLIPNSSAKSWNKIRQ